MPKKPPSGWPGLRPVKTPSGPMANETRPIPVIGLVPIKSLPEPKQPTKKPKPRKPRGGSGW
jgi:hypothetical protein